MGERINGKIKWFNPARAYGFLTADGDDQTEYFVHYSALLMDGFKTVNADQAVSFILKQTDKGIQATEVMLING